jgi:cyclophilin family peptidyl-prolyl cis-trans isomerase
MRGLPAVALALLALTLAGCGGGDDTTTEAAGPATCEPADVPEARPDGGAEKPTAPLQEGVTHVLVFATNCGEFTVTLDPASAPEATASLVALAQAGFFDDTLIHRIVPGFVIQGGDPTGTGAGGPGYQTVDPPPAGAAYTHGVVAMAKAADEAPGTAGSQFFVVTGDDVGLQPDYAVVGEVTEGLDVVDRIGQLGDPATEQPTETVVVESVTAGEA